MNVCELNGKRCGWLKLKFSIFFQGNVVNFRPLSESNESTKLPWTQLLTYFWPRSQHFARHFHVIRVRSTRTNTHDVPWRRTDRHRIQMSSPIVAFDRLRKSNQRRPGRILDRSDPRAKTKHLDLWPTTVCVVSENISLQNYFKFNFNWIKNVSLKIFLKKSFQI
jgi:hypothetical protein